MLNFLVQRPVAVLMSFLGALILGLIAGQILPISLLPDIPIPRLSVQVSYANTSAAELEKTVVTPIRNQLLQLDRLEDLSSRTGNGQATVELFFEYGTNTDLTFIEVNEKIDQVMGRLPRGLERPRVLKTNIADIPVFFLSVVPKRLESMDETARQAYLLELSDFCRNVLKRRMEQLEEIAFVDMSGLAFPELRIVPKTTVLQSMGMSEETLADVLRRNNLSLGSIIIRDGHYQYNLKLNTQLSSPEAVQNIYFQQGERLLQLKDVAHIELARRPEMGRYQYEQQRAFLFSVRKKADARLFSLKENFEVLLNSFKEDYPELEFHLSNDQTKLLQVSVDNLLSSLYYGAFFAFLVLLIFFREWRSPVLIGLAVPIALIIALLGFYLLNISINTISLSGLILGVGLMIDNSIIVIDNIRQQRRLGLPLTEACVVGGNEVIRPLLSSALTTCAVFFPLIFLSGTSGALFYDQAVSISVALAASLITAFILLPTLSRIFEKKKKVRAESREEWLHRANTSWYARSVDPFLTYRWVVFLLFPFVLWLAWLGFRASPQEAFPEFTREGLLTDIDWNEPIQLKENQDRIEVLLDYLDGTFISSSGLIGEQQFALQPEARNVNEAELWLYTEDPEKLLELGQKVQQWFAEHYPLAQVKSEPIKTLFDEIFTTQKPFLVAHLKSIQTQERPTSEELAPLLDRLDQQGFQYVVPPQTMEYQIRILQEKALVYDVPYDNIYHQLKSLFNINEVGSLKGSNQLIPILLGSERRDFQALLQAAQVRNRQGKELPLRDFIELSRSQDVKFLTATSRGPSLDLQLTEEREDLQEEVSRAIRQAGRLTGHFSGRSLEDARSVRELLWILLVSLALLYLILAAQFESLLQPLIVMLTVPLGLAGAIGMLWLSGQSVNLVSIIGMIVMSGIVVNDAILKVDMMNRLSGTYSLKEAIHGAGQRRLRPILMTSLTTILALTPILFSEGLGAELQRPLAFAVIGGLLSGTLASLYFIPVVYWVFRGGKKTIE
jgi:multidrug efflux pump subunit AcrB